MSDDPRYTHHYSREERLSMPGAPEPRARPKGFFRGNRGLIILLIDVIIIAVMAVIYRQFLFSPAFEGDLAGYSLALRGFPLSNRVVVELLVERSGEEATQGKVFVVFTAGGAEMRLSEDLPREAVTLEGALLIEETPDEVAAEVSIGGESLVLRRRLTRN